jgi:hypothetical protein
MDDYRCWNKYGEEGLNEIEMRDSYLKREVPTGIDEDQDDVNEADILGFTDDNIEFQVHNIEEMVHNVERHGDNDQYSNGKLAKNKKMIENSKKSFYHGCATQYMRLFMMVKFFQLKTGNKWSDYSFKNLLMLLKDMLPQGNAVRETVYKAKQIIHLLGLEVEKFTHARIIAFYIVGLSTKILINALFIDSTDSIVEKTTMMMRTPTEIEEKVGQKRCFGTFLSFLV